MSEYAILIACIAVAVLLAYMAFGHEITVWFQHLARVITST